MVFSFILMLFSVISYADSDIQFKDKGELTFETLFFENDKSDTTNDQNYSLKLRYELKAKKQNWLTKARGFIRQDVHDQNRDIAIPEEIWLSYEKHRFNFKYGYQIINWSATEAFHPVDNINSRNFDSEAQNAEKIGELMGSIKYTYGNGSLNFLHMPLFTAPNFAPPSSRLGFSGNQANLPDPVWVKDGKIQSQRQASQYGVFLSHNFDNSDLVLSYLESIDRNRPGFTLLTTNQVTPLFFEIKQYGLTYQYVLDAYLLKLEAAYLDFKDTRLEQTNFYLSTPKDHLEIAPGLEWTQPLAKGSELTYLIEYQRYFDTDKKHDDFYFFQNDLLLGTRYALNDDIGQEILFNVILDLAGRKEFFYNLDYARRIGNFWQWKLGLRIIDATMEENKTNAVGLEQIRRTDRIYSNLTRYF